MKKVIWALAASWLFWAVSWGAPPHPILVERLKEEGKWEEFKAKYKSLWNYDQPNPNPYRFIIQPGAAAGAAPPDTIKVVMIYAAPSDRPWNHPPDGADVTGPQLDSILFGNNPTGSMTDYYREVSYGQTVVVGDVYGPFPLPQTNAFYTFGSSGLPATTFVNDALTAADPTVNFAQYDYNNNGVIDGLFVIHSGPGAEETGSPNDIWSHASGISRVLDGKSIFNYAIQPEESGNQPIQIGVFCHESGHSLMGIQDLYDTDGSSEGVGVWCLMGSGNYQNNSKTPVHFSAWSKKRIGWLTMTNVAANQNNVSFPTSQYTPTAYRLWTNGGGGIQYFLVENRIKRGFDSFLPGNGGLLIWHIDEGVSTNSDENRYLVGLEQADGLAQLNLGSNRGDGGDPFPGSSNNRNFDEFSNPNSKANVTNAVTKVAVFNISDLDSVMTANLEITYGRPRVASFTKSVNDAAGNGNGLPEPGETFNFYFSFTNLWLGTTGWNVRVRTNDTALVVTDSSAFIATLPGLGASTSTSPDPVSVQVPANLSRSRLDSFFVVAWNFDSSHTFQGSFLQQIGATQALLVDDDHGRSLENYYKLPFDSALVPLNNWSVQARGVPPADSLTPYRYLVWFTGNDSVSLLNPGRIASLSAYLNGGGNLLLTGQGIAQSLGAGPDSVFLRNYFHCRFNAAQTPTLRAKGFTGHPLANGMRLVLLGGDGASNQTEVDNLSRIDGRADELLYYVNNFSQTSGPTAAMAYADSVYKAVFFGFGFEAISSLASSPPNNADRRSNVIGKVLDWFDSGPSTGLAVPYITHTPLSLSFQGEPGGPPQPAESLHIENTGGGALSWTLSENPPAGWLSLSLASGNAPSTVGVTADPSALSAGTYYDTLVIDGTGSFNTPQKVVVTFTVAQRGDLDVSGVVDATDVVQLLICVFLDPSGCNLFVGDLDCDLLLTASDVVILLNAVFLGDPYPC